MKSTDEILALLRTYKPTAVNKYEQIKTAIETILERATVVKDPNDFLCSPGGMLRLDAISYKSTL